jgi:hypothetical protein
LFNQQVPPAYLAQEKFSSIDTFVITGHELSHKIIIIEAFDRKIIGCPVRIENARYHRNALLFNLCFVVALETDTAPFEPILRKLVGSFTSLELEREFISKKQSTHFEHLLSRIFHGLNSKGECILSVDEANSINLKLFPGVATPVVVLDHQVPVLIKELDNTLTADWDLALVCTLKLDMDLNQALMGLEYLRYL